MKAKLCLLSVGRWSCWHHYQIWPRCSEASIHHGLLVQQVGIRPVVAVIRCH